MLLFEWLNYLETLHPVSIDLSLERVRLVAEKLELTSFDCPVITIGGTNGKGSCVAFLEAILQSEGHRVGAYTSPHLLVFNERIRINGQNVADPLIIQSFEKIEIARENISLTYFEFITLAALLLFKQAKLDIIILEVGLGGRLDAVNVVEPDISIITTVAMDHTEWLGETREAIAQEKAGIFRANKPAICGDEHPPASIFNIANKLGSKLYCLKRDFDYEISGNTWQWQSKNTHYSNLPIPHLPIQNAATALMALECLEGALEPGLPRSFHSLATTSLSPGLPRSFHSLATTSLPGRFQQIGQIIFDVAHNPASSTLLAKRLHTQKKSGKTFAVASILRDKDISETLRPMLPYVDDWYLAGLNLPRGETAEILANHLHKLGETAYHVADSLFSAFDQAVEACGPDDQIVVFGSFHTVGPILEKVINLTDGEVVA